MQKDAWMMYYDKVQMFQLIHHRLPEKSDNKRLAMWLTQQRNKLRIGILDYDKERLMKDLLINDIIIPQFSDMNTLINDVRDFVKKFIEQIQITIIKSFPTSPVKFYDQIGVISQKFSEEISTFIEQHAHFDFPNLFP